MKAFINFKANVNIRYFLKGLFLIVFMGVLWGCVLDPGATEEIVRTEFGYQPTITISGMPDLVITTIYPEIREDLYCLDQTTGIGLVIVMTNQGESRSKAFSLYINGLVRRVPFGLESGEKYIYWEEGFVENVSAVIDYGNQIEEEDEQNNQLLLTLEYPTDIPTCPEPTKEKLPTLESSAVLEGHTGPVLDIEFSPLGELIASGSTDNTLRLWLVKEGRILRKMTGHPFPISSLDFIPSGYSIITGSYDGLIRHWRVNDGVLLHTDRGHAGWILDVAVTPNGRFYATTAEDFTIRVWRVIDGKPQITIDEGFSTINDLEYHPDGKYLAVVEKNGNLRIWVINDERWEVVLPASESSANCVSFSNQGDLIAVGYSDNSIRIWKTHQWEEMVILSEHLSPVTSLDFSRDGKWLVTGSEDGSIFLWEFDRENFQFTPRYTLVGHNDVINQVHFSPGGSLMASGSGDSTIRIWNVPKP